MISVHGYNLKYRKDHLLCPKPKTYKDIFDRLENIECNLFYNIISSPNCYYEKRYDNRINFPYKTLDAEERFKNIFKERILYANPKSFFINKLNISPNNCDEIKSVSFTLSDYKVLPKHFKARSSDYGICFFHDFLQNKGIRPVTYLNENKNSENKDFVFNSPHLIEIYNDKYDMRWENEWRINANVEFTADDIAFVIVPQDRLNYFVDYFYDIDGFSDIGIISSNAYKSPIDHLIFYPQQGDNNWSQIRIFASEFEKGFPLSPEDYNDLENLAKIQFASKYEKELDCFAKNTILLNYEYRFIDRFMRFRNQIKNIDSLGELFQDYNLVRENRAEPIDAQRDMIIGLFKELFMENPFDY